MNDKEHLYSIWLARRKQIAAPESFSQYVMDEIDRVQARQVSPPIADPPHCLNHPLYRWMAASGLVLLGIFRIFYIAGSLFRTNLVMPY